VTQVFPKIQVKNIFLSDGAEAATAKAAELGVGKKIDRWLREWGSQDEPGEAPEPEQHDELTDEQLKRMGVKFTRLSKSEGFLAKAWHESQEELRRRMPERLAAAAATRQQKKANRKLKKETVVDEWTAIKKEARKRGLDPYDLLADRRKKDAGHKPAKGRPDPNKKRR
jgi:hypothetical protein